VTAAHVLQQAIEHLTFAGPASERRRTVHVTKSVTDLGRGLAAPGRTRACTGANGRATRDPALDSNPPRRRGGGRFRWTKRRRGP
jgi:hypothetical protein